MNDKSKLVFVPIGKLAHHPKNPRKDLGDLSELTESIKKNGIMQNLTVVPKSAVTDASDKHAEYYVVIGNRRFEAAKHAGLKELPCIISAMDEQEQVSTMLVENMQRTDLTYYEQAMGFQMMFDFGNSIDTIAEKTGFSASTVRRRMKLAELDGEALKKASTRQFTLDDLDKLNQIDSVEKRNELLRDIGTSNFKYSVQNAINAQKREAVLAELAAECEKRGFTYVEGINYSEYTYIATYSKKDIEKVDEKTAGVGEVVYTKQKYGEGTIALYRKRDAKSNEADRERERVNAEREKARRELEAAHETAAKLREEFITAYSNTNAKKNIKIISDFLVYSFFLPSTWNQFDGALFVDTLGMDLEEGDDLTYAVVKDKTVASPEKAILCMAFAQTEDSRQNYYDWEGRFDSNARLDKLYEFLTALGYEMSDEEKALQNGTSPLYRPADEDDEDEEDEEEEDDYYDEDNEDYDEGDDESEDL